MVVMVAALRAMQAARDVEERRHQIVLTGDEEDTGRPIEIARRDLIAAGKWADVALDFEGLSQSTTAATWDRSRGAARAAGR